MASSEVLDSDLPEEISEKITNFHDSLVSVEALISKVVSEPINKIHEKLTPVDKAKFDLVMTYSLNSLYWMYLITQGENPKDHQVKSELERIREYMNKVKEIVDKEKRPKLNTDATKRFVKGALWTPNESSEKADEIGSDSENGEDTTPVPKAKAAKRKKKGNRGLKKKLKT